MQELSEQQMRALEMRAEGLRHLSTVALTLAGVLLTVAETLFRDAEPAKIWTAAALFLGCAFMAIVGQESVIGELTGPKSRKRYISLLSNTSYALFGAGWAMLMAQGARLLAAG